MKTIVFVFLYMIICSVQIYSISADELNLNAKAAVIMDAESGKILYGKSKDQNAKCKYDKDFDVFIYFRTL